MSEKNIDYGGIKKIVKESIVETLKENKELIHDLFVEAMEDVAMIEAIKEGRKSKLVSEDEISKILSS
jgi:DNA-binding protein YbaB